MSDAGTEKAGSDLVPHDFRLCNKCGFVGWLPALAAGEHAGCNYRAVLLPSEPEDR